MGNTTANQTRMLNNTCPNTTTAEKQNKYKTYSAITYVPVLTEALKKQFNYFLPDIGIAPKPPNKNSRFFANQKSRIPKTEKAGCVYCV